MPFCRASAKVKAESSLSGLSFAALAGTAMPARSTIAKTRDNSFFHFAHSFFVKEASFLLEVRLSSPSDSHPFCFYILFVYWLIIKANGIAFLLNCGFEKAFIHIDPKIAKVQHLNLIIYKKFTNEAHLKLFLSTNPCFGGILLFG